MNNFFRKWRGPAAVLAAMLGSLVADAAPLVETLGGGPNLTSPKPAGSTDGGTFSFAKFNNPFGVALDTNGNLLIADRSNGKIRKITHVGEADSQTTTLISKLRLPVAVAVNSSNLVYVLTEGDGSLRKFTGNGSLVQTVSGLRLPTALVLTSTGTVFVTELGGTVRQITPDGTITLVASGFRKPRGIALLPSGLLAITESSGHAVYTVDPFTGTSVLLAGGNGAGYSDGSGLAAKFNQPYGIAAAPNGTLVVADYKNNRVRVVGTNNIVTTLYGMSSKEWLKPFPGWRDGTGGEEGTAAARLPVGVTFTPQGTLFVTETYYDLIRRATGTGLEGSPVFGTNSTGVSTNDVIIGTNVVSVIGTNVVSFGFESGEASSDFVGAAGQSFYAPVTLSVANGQKAYTFQMSLSATGETGVLLNPFDSGFVSMLMKPIPGTTYYEPIPPSDTFLNSSINLLGIGWFERYTKTNLYDTLAQTLISFSLAKNNMFSGEKVILGAYRLSIPSGAPNGAAFRIALQNPSGTTDGVSTPLNLRVPTDGSLGAGALNTIKRVTLGSRLYLVGDNVPFRWFNAGDFGDANIANSDVIDLFQTVAYGLNTAIPDSDLFNAMDSSDGSVGTDFGDDVSINGIMMGDNDLNVDDVWVTFRRSLDPTLKWFARYWSNGVRQVVEVPNTLTSGFGQPATLTAASKRAATLAPAIRPTAELTVEDTLTGPNTILELPVRLKVETGYHARVMMLNVTIEALDGSPAMTASIQFQTSPVFHNPEFSDSHGLNNYAAAWLDTGISGLSGDSILAFLTVQVPANAGTRAAYRVHFEHFSASPNGVALFDTHVSTGLILL
ncbi:MAG TPA: hypothetical protein VK846_05515, partial [Candidatus Limnocylindria bacterium]|nr:hypothetical protein [Candidatus Limnocylindria bacterium]